MSISQEKDGVCWRPAVELWIRMYVSRIAGARLRRNEGVKKESYWTSGRARLGEHGAQRATRSTAVLRERGWRRTDRHEDSSSTESCESRGFGAARADCGTCKDSRVQQSQMHGLER